MYRAQSDELCLPVHLCNPHALISHTAVHKIKLIYFAITDNL